MNIAGVPQGWALRRRIVAWLGRGMMSGALLWMGWGCSKPAHSWQASSGLLPHQSNGGWSMQRTADRELPSLLHGVLTLESNPPDERLCYWRDWPEVSATGPFFFEARLRYAWSSDTIRSQTPICLAGTVREGEGFQFYVDEDSVFFAEGPSVAGERVELDTAGSFHTYRLEYDGAGRVTAYYDGEPILTGSTFIDRQCHTDTVRLCWGDETFRSAGGSQWQYVRHDVGAQAELKEEAKDEPQD